MSGRLVVEHHWGTAITVDVREPCDPQPIAEAFRWFGRVDELFSTWRPDSEISRLARGELDPDQCAPEVTEVLELCELARERSGGAYDVRVGADPRVPPREGLGPIDPSGLVKGWAIDRAGRRLREAGITRFAIAAGGDVCVADAEPGAAGWRVGIQHPHERRATAAVISVRDVGIATSGVYELGAHIIDPRLGAPARGLTAATVVSAEPAMADAYATAAMVLGAEAMPWLTQDLCLPAMVVTNDDQVITNAAFDALRAA